MTGKGNHHVVSVYIPDDCVEGLRKLADPDIRKDAGILPDNKFLFPTKSSDIYISGWHVLKEVCGNCELQKPELINGTNNRHRLSTVFATLNVSKEVRDGFFSHMGHSEEVNRNIYQTPMALHGVQTYGRQLLEIDRGMI